MTQFEKNMMHEATEQTPLPLNKWFLYDLGKVTFLRVRIWFYLKFIAIYIPVVFELRTLRYFQINKSIK